MLHFTLPQFTSLLKNSQYLKLNVLQINLSVLQIKLSMSQIKTFAMKSVRLVYVMWTHTSCVMPKWV